MSIKPEYLPLDGLLHNQLFRIPNYQRHYSWEKKQRDDLFNDIRKIKDFADRNHFMATIVCLNTRKNEKLGSDKFSVLEVVDGQQRITTLIILLKAISKELKNNGDDESSGEAKKIDDILVKKDNRLVLLQTNHDNSRFFENYLTKGEIPSEDTINTIADKNLYHALNECEDFVKGWKNESSVIELLSLLKNRLYFILQILDEEASVYTIFEVLNSRGLEVDWLDKCKSMLMGLLYENSKKNVSSELIDELHKMWCEIYDIIGLTNVPGYEIIRFAATLKKEDISSKTLNEEDSLQYFREYCSKGKKPTNIRNIREITSWLLGVTQKLTDLYNNRRLKTVTEITQARLLAVAILLRSDLKENDRNKLLGQWERTTFRVYGIFGKDSRTKVGDYVKAAHYVYNSKSKDIGKILDMVKNIGYEYPIGDAIKELEKSDCYNGWTEELRYFFYRYEEYCSQNMGGELTQSVWSKIWEANVSKTIEHIYPKDEDAPQLPQWKGKIRGDATKHIHRLGNLILLPPDANSAAGQKSFAEKKKIYKKNYLYLMNDVLSKRDWTKDSIEKREKILLKFARKTWNDL